LQPANSRRLAWPGALVHTTRVNALQCIHRISTGRSGPQTRMPSTKDLRLSRTLARAVCTVLSDTAVNTPLYKIFIKNVTTVSATIHFYMKNIKWALTKEDREKSVEAKCITYNRIYNAECGEWRNAAARASAQGGQWPWPLVFIQERVVSDSGLQK